MDLQLTGKKALVSGSTAGIGYGIALALAREGAEVVVNGRTEARVNEAVAHLKKELGDQAKITGVAADLGTADGVETITREVPTVDVLVNNLGIFEPKAFADITDEDWTRFFEVNVLSGVRLSRFHLPRMTAAGWGRIVFISSESGVNTPTEMIHYGLTKTAQLALSRGLAQTAKGTGVTVNSVLPGPTASEGVGTFVEQMARDRGITPEQMEKDFFEHARPSSLLKRFETVAEIADAVAFVCSPLAAAITGAALRVDGGVVSSIV
ncbi:MAG: SDR family oxidoreductase [Rhodospirillales bacterium]|nr:SDR family oxidoreductase [Acetobacter sp.]